MTVPPVLGDLPPPYFNKTLDCTLSAWPPSQLIGGDVQSYQGSRVVFLEGVKLRMADVPLTNAMYRHLEAREFQQAYTVASLGVTQVAYIREGNI